ncbi:hypothetical protein [Pseudonocardia lacus]|uniref:hypothetical protein n=1 Tax=Pseudonocardia lacus TaxID=2835865 RepID=UPI001BDCBB91|nr:hypothetical protein [Pseudonocardia lacus]
MRRAVPDVDQGSAAAVESTRVRSMNCSGVFASALTALSSPPSWSTPRRSASRATA